MRVLDAHDGRDLVSFLKGDSHRQVKDDNKSLAESSLAYSTDNESYNPRSLATDNESSLRGADLLTLGGYVSTAMYCVRFTVNARSVLTLYLFLQSCCIR
jgi:hypothetical protein